MSYEKLSDAEIDVGVAEKVMGWTRKPRKGQLFPSSDSQDEYHWQWAPPGKDPETHWQKLPDYSTDIAAAFEVVEKMRDLGCDVDIYALVDGVKKVNAVEISKDGSSEIIGSSGTVSIPRAICEAALSALDSK